MYLYLYLKYII